MTVAELKRRSCLAHEAEGPEGSADYDAVQGMVGGCETVRTDVRVIAATHRDLRAWSEEGKFRSDLYYRLGVFVIHLPPLRERGEDLPLLVRHFLGRFGCELGREVREVAPEAMDRLRGYSWPGNVRELQSVLRQALLRASGRVLVPAVLPELPGPPPPVTAGPVSVLEEFIRGRLREGSEALSEEVHRELDRVLLPLVKEHTRGNQFQASSMLGVARQTLRRRLHALRIRPRFPARDEPEAAHA
jgi:two-component system nitrogen regulation response regulator GlnG